MNIKQKDSTRRRADRPVTFAAGLVLGVGLAVAAPAVGDSTDKAVEIVSTMLYSISSLAVDTETNAAKIVELEERLDDLEAKLAKK